MKPIPTMLVRNYLRKEIPFDKVEKIPGGYRATLYMTSTKPRGMSRAGHVRRIFEELLGPFVEVDVRFPNIKGDLLREVASFHIEMRIPDAAVRAAL